MKHRFLFIGMILLLFIAILFGVALGGVNIPIKETIKVFMNRDSIDPMNESIIMAIRLPRVIMAALVGAALAIAGTIMQGVFRNPLADPGIIGVSAGGTFGAVLVIFLGWSLVQPFLVPVAGFIGAMTAVIITYHIATTRNYTHMGTLLLAGIAISTFLNAFVSLMLSFAKYSLSQQILFWLMGDLNGSQWSDVYYLTIPILLGVFFLIWFSKELDIMQLGDEQAENIGLDLHKLRRILLVVASLLTGISVAFTGTIGFVGLIVPHIMRFIVGSSHRILIPASAIGGAIFLIIADMLSRILIPPAEIQVGIITSFFGAPFFLYLVWKNKQFFARR